MKIILYNLYNLIIIHLNNFRNIKRYCKFKSYIIHYRYINQDIRKGINKLLFLFFIYLLLIRIIEDIFK